VRDPVRRLPDLVRAAGTRGVVGHEHQHVLVVLERLEKELRSLRASYEAGRGEARKLVAALAEQTEGGDNRSITDRLAELDLRAAQIEVRIAEIQRTLVAMTSRPVDRTDVAHALPGTRADGILCAQADAGLVALK